MLYISESGKFQFEAFSLSTAFLLNMMVTRGAHGLTSALGLKSVPNLHPNDAGDWALKTIGEPYHKILFRHIHREAGRNDILAALDSVKATTLAGRITCGIGNEYVIEAREVAKAIREIPLPYKTDEEASADKAKKQD